MHGSVILIGGDPGIGKSTLLTQTLATLGQDLKALYVTGEESLQQVTLRARRLGQDPDIMVDTALAALLLLLGACGAPTVRTAPDSGDARADYTPVLPSLAPELMRSRKLRIDVALISVSPPDEHGFCSFGVGVDATKAAVENARTVIALVNQQMPRSVTPSRRSPTV